MSITRCLFVYFAFKLTQQTIKKNISYETHFFFYHGHYYPVSMVVSVQKVKCRMDDKMDMRESAN